MGRIIIYCFKYDEVTALYHLFIFKLSKTFTYPPDAPDIGGNRLVDMYTHSHSSVKDKILAQFIVPSPLCVIIATMLLGWALIAMM